MPGRDYLLNLIEQAVQVIVRIAQLREDDKPDAALAEVVQAVKWLFGMPMEEIGSLDADALYAQLSDEEGPDVARDKCLAFAALAQQAGLSYEQKGLTALAQAAFHISLEFTLRGLSAAQSGIPPGLVPDVEALLAKLDGFELSPRTRELLAKRAGGGAP
ncbi:MAG TPA: hypothetical protein VGG37_02130 [Opitutaceae bacterium]|jgi:hypothetical protein